MFPISTAKPLNLWEKQEIKDFHEMLAKTKLEEIGWVVWSKLSDGNIMPSFKGICHIVQNLLDKKNFEPFLIRPCLNVAALRDVLEGIEHVKAFDQDYRCAYLVPTHSSTHGANREGVVAGRSEYFYQHLVCVVVEIKKGFMHIALLDPMIRWGNETVNPENIGYGPEYEGKPFTEQELILSYILEANLDPATTFIYHSKVLRQKTNGCWAFAIKDALEFVRNTQFFNEIQTEHVMTRIGNYTLSTITTLPAPFMLGAHYTKELFQKHLRDHPEHDTPEIRAKLEKHRIEDLNYRIGHATVRWFQMILKQWES